MSAMSLTRPTGGGHHDPDIARRTLRAPPLTIGPSMTKNLLRPGARSRASGPRLRTIGAVTAAALLFAGLAAPAASAADEPWMDTSLSSNERAQLLVDAMDLDQKVAALIQSGGPGVPELGIPAIRGKDGCCGASVTDTDSTALPTGIALASAFDSASALSYGAVMGGEARYFGFNGLAGPTMDLNTTPLNGRMWEAFGEDPLLSGTTAAAQTTGIQSEDISVIAKHYNLNNQETRRGDVDAVVDERTLQEVYTRPWETLVRDADPGSIMCAFNKVNGEYSCGNDELLNGILKTQLGFQGYVSSDFNATKAITDYEAGLDVSGPGTEYSGENLKQAVLAGVVSEERLDDAVRRVLRTFFEFGIIDNPPADSFVNPQPAATALTEAIIVENDAVARSVADASAVLLKNEGLLPLQDDSADTVAVIGSDADHYIDGGGSGAVQRPTRLTTALDGITDRADATVTYTPGTDPVSLADTLPGPAPVPSSVLTGTTGEAGLTAEYYLGTEFGGSAFLTRSELQANLRTGISNDAINTSQVPGIGFPLATVPLSARWTGTLTAPSTGSYGLSLSNYGTATLSVDGQVVVTDPGTTFDTRTAQLDLVEGQRYAIVIEYRTDVANQFAGGLNDQAGAMLRFGWTPPAGVLSPTIAAAVEAARTADTAVIVARDYTGEAADRGTLALPQDQDALIRAVAAVNPDTVVVLATSGPVEMPWIDDVSAVLETWYAGQAQGSSLAALLYGDVNPSGKLPVTFPVDDEQVADLGIQLPFEQVGELSPTTEYTAGIQVGYKTYVDQGATPLFAFGHGLSYSRFDYSDTTVTTAVDPTGTSPVAATATVTVTNTGDVAGTEVVQAYVGNLSTDVETVDRALAGWTRVTLEPGQSADVEIALDRRSFQYWDAEQDQWATPVGTVALSIGGASDQAASTGTVAVLAADTTAPTVSIATDPAAPTGSNGWYRDDVTVTVTAQDDRDQAPKIEASVNGADFAPVTGPIVLTEDGTTTVRARATDAAGNVSEETEVTVKIDGTAPVVAASEDRRKYRLTLTASDETSGVQTVQYRYQIRVDGKTRMTPWLTYRSPVLFGLPRYVKVEYRATDIAGNTSPVGVYR